MRAQIASARKARAPGKVPGGAATVAVPEAEAMTNLEKAGPAS